MSFGLVIPQGEAYERLWHSVPSWCAWTSVFILAAFGSWLIISRSESLLHCIREAWLSAKPSAKCTLYIFWCLFVIVLLDGRGFANGFVRQDDFSFLQVVRENDRLLPQLLTRHNDHAYPLFRLQVWLIVKIAGPDIGAAGLAMWFNGLIFFSCASLLLAGIWLLKELGCSALAGFVFPALLWLWPGWGEFATGFFTLVAYVQVLACGVASAAAAWKYSQTGFRAWGALSLLLVVLAVGIDTTGYSAFAILGMFSLCGFASHRNARSLKLLGCLIVTFVLLQMFFHAVFSQPYSPRELVQNPAGESFSPFDFRVNRAIASPVVATLMSAPGGVMLGYAAPVFLQFYNGRLTPDLVLALNGFQLAVFVVLAWWMWPLLKRLEAKNRIIAGGLFLCTLSGVGMLIVARTDYVAATPIFLWHPKYLAFPISWLCLAGVFVADRLRLIDSSQQRGAAVRGAVLTLVGAWFAFSVWHFERALLPDPTAYVARGRYGNLVNAKARLETYHAVMEQLRVLANQRGGDLILELPSPEKWSEEFFKRYSILEWGGDRGSHGATHLFWDMPSAAPNLRLMGRWIPADSVDEHSRLRLMSVPWISPAFRSSKANLSPEGVD